MHANGGAMVVMLGCRHANTSPKNYLQPLIFTVIGVKPENLFDIRQRGLFVFRSSTSK
jgi:hypothetical protein